MKKAFRSYAIMTAGCVIYGLAFDWFFASNLVAMGGVTGLAQVIHAVAPALSVGVLSFLINVPLFIAGWKFIGFRLLATSLFCMVVCSAAIDGIALFVTFPVMDPMLSALCGGALMGVGIGMVFSQGATTGGTDIVARLLKLKMPWLPMGKLILLPDAFVLTLAAIVFGQVEAALYGLVSMVVCARLMDRVLYGMDASKVAYIISDQWRTIADELLLQDRGVTILQGEGAYTGDGKRILLIAFRQQEIVTVKQIVHQADPTAFLIVCDAHDVLGEGFGEYKKEEI